MHHLRPCSVPGQATRNHWRAAVSTTLNVWKISHVWVGYPPFQTSPSRRAPALLRAAPRRRRRLRRPGGSTWSSTGLHPSAIAEEGLLDESRGVRAVDQGMTDLHARLPLAPAVVRVSVRLAAVSRPQRCRGHAFCVFRSGKVGIPATKVDRWQSCFPPFQKV